MSFYTQLYNFYTHLYSHFENPIILIGLAAWNSQSD